MEWYEELDYDENPFKDDENTELIGYEEVINDVLYRLASGSMVCVEGKSGAGKTAVLKAVLNKFRGTGKVVYMNGQQLDNGLNIEKVLNKKAGLMKRLFKKKPKGMILLLDEVQHLSKKNCERIKYYFDNNFVKSAVFTSSNFKNANFTDSLKERISKIVKLRELTEDEAVDIVNSRLGNNEIISEEVIKEVFTRSERNMKHFLKNCDGLCTFAFKNNGKKILPEHVGEFFGGNGIQKAEKVESVEEEAEPKRTVQKCSKKRLCSETKSKKVDYKTSKKEDSKAAVEEPVTVTIVDDFKPEKKEVKMDIKEEELYIDSELKRLKKANKLDDDSSVEGYEEAYDDLEEPDDEEEKTEKESYEDEDIAEKYY